MPKPRIFISYSAKHCNAGACGWAAAQGACAPSAPCARQEYERQFVADLVTALQDIFDVLWDNTALLAGDDWRKKLYAQFASCSAALVVLTESALQSNYVPLEAMVLTWRRLVDPNFTVIPVFFQGIDENTVKDPASRFYGVGLEDIQGVKHTRGQEPQTFTTIANAIAASSPAAMAAASLDRIAVLHTLANLLAKADEARLDEAAEEIEPAYEWRPGVPRPFHLALSILRLDLLAAVRALAKVVSALDGDERRELFNLVAPGWVALRAAEPLWRLGFQPAPKRLPVLNASWNKAPEHYLRRAWSHTGSEPIILPVTAADDGTGEGFRQAIVHAFRDLYVDREEDGALDEPSSDDTVIELLHLRFTERMPVYVVVRHGNGVSEQALVSVQGQLPVTILYARPDATAATCGPDALLLEPVLTAQAEATATLHFKHARGVLLGANPQ